MINPAGLCDQACRHQREAYRASAEAMDLRIALARMGCRPSEEQIAMSRRFDEAAREAAERASIELLFLLNQQPAFERAA
jgi:Fe-S cluster assembly iron-binding protein IscA